MTRKRNVLCTILDSLSNRINNARPIVGLHRGTSFYRTTRLPRYEETLGIARNSSGDGVMSLETWRAGSEVLGRETHEVTGLELYNVYFCSLLGWGHQI